MDTASLKARLAGVRRRLIWISATAGFFWSLFAVIGVLLVAVWLDLIWELSPQSRVAWLIIAGSLGLVLFAALCVRLWRKSAEAIVVRQLDQAARSGGAILSGWELSRQYSTAANESPKPLTAGLAGLAVSQANQLALTVKPADAVTPKPVKVSSTVLGSAVLLVGVLGVCLPALAMTQWRRFVSPFADVPPFSNVQFTIEPGDATILYGEGLNVRATVEGEPVEQVELIMESGEKSEVVPMFPEPAGGWRAVIAQLNEDAEYFVRAERARSERYRIHVITTPKIESVRFEITPPAYTRDAGYKGPLPQGGILGPAGTRVRLWAKSNRPLAGGVIEIHTGDETETLAMSASNSDDHEAFGEFTVRSNGRFLLRVKDADDQLSQETFGGAITLVSDQRPFVRLIQPREQSLATPTANVPVVIAAEDDYGLSRVQLFRSLNGSRPLPLDVPIKNPPPRRTQVQVPLELSAYGLSPGDEIKIFARVEDNDPAGAKGAESSVAMIRIISQSDFEQMVRARAGLEVLISKYQQAQRRMEALKEEIEKLEKKLSETDPDSPAGEELRKDLERLGEQFQREADAISQAAKHLLPYDLDRNLMEQLEKVARELEESADKLQQLSKDRELTNKLTKEQLANLAKALGQRRTQLDQEANEPLEHLAKVFPLMEAQSRFTALVMQQTDLAERLASLKGRDGEDDPALKARMRELEEEQRQLREELKNLIDKIEQDARRLPEEEAFTMLRQTALDFVEAVRGSGASEAMSAAETGLAEFSGTEGHANAQKAAEILRKFLKQCQGMGEAGGQCLAFQPTLAACLGNTVGQLLAEAGLSMGQGMGAGMGGGYSARRNSMNNMGLYGGLPALAAGNFGGGGQAESHDEGAGQFSGGFNTSEPSVSETDAQQSATGSAGGAAPLRYRQKVGQYLRRLAEELDE